MRDETAQLRAGLDERGIFWIDIPRSDRKRTCWKSTDDQAGYCYFDEDIFGVTELMVTGISAEEVIAATLGPGTCQVDTTESWLPAERYHRCKHCGAFFAVLDASSDIPPRSCPNCCRRIEVTSK